MKLSLAYFTTAAGHQPALEYIQSLPERDRARLLAALADLETNGLRGSAVAMRQLQGKLWEIKVDAHRVFYVVIEGPMMVLLHGCKKQSQKARSGDVEIAQERMTLLLGSVEDEKRKRKKE